MTNETPELLPCPTIEMLRKLLRYEPDTGKLFWRERTPDMFSDNGNGAASNAAGWNLKHSGREALVTIDADGYKVGEILGNGYKSHRVIWAMETGEWPIEQIDHEDHNRQNNRFVNLREATHIENARNQKLSTENTSGVVGVGWNKAHKHWVARIYVNRKEIYLGGFKKKEDAISARKKAEKEIGFHINHGTKFSEGEG